MSNSVQTVLLDVLFVFIWLFFSLGHSDLGRVKLSSSDVLVTASRLLTRGLSRDLEETVLDLLANLAESGE